VKKTVSLKKSLVLLLCLTIMLAVPIIASARYTYISGVEASFSIKNGQASCYGDLYGKQTYPLNIKVELQQKQTDGSWKTLATWTNSETAAYTDAGGSSSVPSGFTYRCYVTGTIYGENGYASVERPY
jgi:hypothetical protein